MLLLCWSCLGHTRPLGNATGRRESTSAANLSQSQRLQEILTGRHRTSMPPTCWTLLGQCLMPRASTERRKSTSVAHLLETWCPQGVPTERHKPSMPPIRRLLPGLLLPLGSATVKQKSVKAADLLRSRWSPAPLTVRCKSRRAAQLLVGAGAFSFSFVGYGASDVRPRWAVNRTALGPGGQVNKMPHRRVVLYAGRRRGTTVSSLNRVLGDSGSVARTQVEQDIWLSWTLPSIDEYRHYRMSTSALRVKSPLLE